MRSDIIEMLNQDEDYWIFLREYPYWHELLSYYPEKIKDFIEEYKVIRRKRLVDKMEDLSLMISLAKELM